MGKIDDDQVEKVEKLLDQLDIADEKTSRQEGDGPELADILDEKLESMEHQLDIEGSDHKSKPEAGGEVIRLDLDLEDEEAEEEAEEEPEEKSEGETEKEAEAEAEAEPEAKPEPEVEAIKAEESVNNAGIVDLSEDEPDTEEDFQEEPAPEEATPEEAKEPVKVDVTKSEDVKEKSVKAPAKTDGTVKKKAAVKKTSQMAQARREKEKEAEQAEEQKKEPLLVRLTPKKLVGLLTRKSVFCLSMGVFAFALTGLLILLWGYYVSEREYDQINSDYVVIGTADAPENSDDGADVVIDVSAEETQSYSVPYLDISVDERKLKALNEDYSFYIVIPGTNIQYPVVQGDDNNHYLRYTYSNQENTAGSIQVDYRTNRDTYLETFNTILHGHNRQDGTMFSDLANYIDESFRDENPYIYIIMDGQEYVYEIFAFYDMIPVAVCYNPNTDDETYLAFINENNTYTNDIEVTLEDHIISLYTCNDDSSMRYLVHAVLREIYDLS